METSIGILGNDFKLSTKVVEKIILKTKANTDQEHITMNIVINNNLFNKTEDELLNILNKLIQSNIDYLILIFDNKRIFNLFKNNTNIPIYNITPKFDS